jgi:hypothetical protein
VLARQRAYFGNFDPVGDVDPILESMLASLLICPSGGLVIVLSSPFGKNILLFRNCKSVYSPAIPSHSEGRYANVTNAGRGCGGR